MSTREVPFSDIQNNGKATLSEWQRSGARPLRVIRRDHEDLVLMTATRAEQGRAVLTAATAMVDALLHANNPGLVRTVVEAAFPWVSYLSNEQAADFIDELGTSLRARSTLDNPAPAARTIEMWRHTADAQPIPNLPASCQRPLS